MNNGTKLFLPEAPVLDQYKQNCVDVLTDALEEAVKGRVSSVALVVCMDEGIATVMAGKNGAALNIGCDDLKQKIHAEIFDKKPKIMRAR